MAITDLATWKERIRDAKQVHTEGGRVVGANHADWRRYVNLYAGRGAGFPELDNIVVNKVFPTIRILHSALSSFNQHFTVNPKKADYADNAKVVKLVMEHFYGEMEYMVQFDRVILDALLCPIGWVKTGFSEELVALPSTVQERKKVGNDSVLVPQYSGDANYNLYVKGGNPWLLRVSPFRMLFDPRPLNYFEAEWYAELITRPLSQLKVNPFYNTKGLEPTHYGRVNEPGFSEYTNATRTDNQIYDMVNYWEIHTVDGQMMVLSENFDSWMLPPTAYPYDISGVVYEPLVLFPVPDMFPMSLTSQLEALQLEKTQLRNYQISHARRFNRKYVTKKGALTSDELVKLERGEDGTVLEANGDPTKAIHVLPDAPVSQDVYMLDRIGDADFREVSGVDELTLGNVQRKETATAHLAQESKFTFRSSKQKTYINQYYNRVAKKETEIVRQKLRDDVFLLLANPKDIQSFKAPFITARPDALSGSFDVSILLVEAEPLSDDVKRAQLIQIMQVLAPWAASPNGIPPAILIILRALVPSYGIHDVDAIMDYLQVPGGIPGQPTLPAPGGALPTGQAVPGANGQPNIDPAASGPLAIQKSHMSQMIDMLRGKDGSFSANL